MLVTVAPLQPPVAPGSSRRRLNPFCALLGKIWSPSSLGAHPSLALPQNPSSNILPVVQDIDALMP